VSKHTHTHTILQVNSALHPSRVAKSSTSFGWGNGGNVTSAGWQETLCDPMWHVSSRSGVAILQTAIHLLLTYSLTYTHTQPFNGPLSRTTWVSWYQKKHSPIHTHEGEEEGFTQTTRSIACELVLFMVLITRVVRPN